MNIHEIVTERLIADPSKMESIAQELVHSLGMIAWALIADIDHEFDEEFGTSFAQELSDQFHQEMSELLKDFVERGRVVYRMVKS